MNRERLREILKRLRDFILCCKKTIDVVEDVMEDMVMEEEEKNKNHIKNINDEQKA